MLTRVTGVVRTEDPFPASPMGFSGEVMVQGEVHPPPRIDVKTGDELETVEDDYIVPPWTAVFQVVKSRDEFSSDYATMDTAIEGDVPHIFANFRDRSFDLVGDNGLRFAGVTPDGIADAEAAEEDPLGSGRTALVMHGSTTLACWRKPFEGAHLGQLVEYIPVDCGWAPDGYEKFSTCLFRPVDLKKIARTPAFAAENHHRLDNFAAFVFSNENATRSVGELHALFPYLPESVVISASPGGTYWADIVRDILKEFVSGSTPDPVAITPLLPSDRINTALMQLDLALGRHNAESMWVSLMRALAAGKPDWDGKMYVKTRIDVGGTAEQFIDLIENKLDTTNAEDKEFFDGLGAPEFDGEWYYASAAKEPHENTLGKLFANGISVGWHPKTVRENRKNAGFVELEYSEDLVEDTYGPEIKDLPDREKESLWGPASQWRYRGMIFRAMAENYKRKEEDGELPQAFDSLYESYARIGYIVPPAGPYFAKVTNNADAGAKVESFVVPLSEALTLCAIAKDYEKCEPVPKEDLTIRDIKRIKTSAPFSGGGSKRRKVTPASEVDGSKRRNHLVLNEIQWTDLKAQLEQIPVDPQRIIGEFIQATRGENEIRVLLRKPHIF